MLVLKIFSYVDGDTYNEKMIKMVIPVLLGKKRKSCGIVLETWPSGTSWA